MNAKVERGPDPYQYVVLRCVPRVDREEFVNVGVVLFCQERDFLEATFRVDADRVRALDAAVDLAGLDAGLRFVCGVCAADPAVGQVSGESAGVRFGFLKAPRSTVVQPGPVHGGLTEDPAAELLRLLDRLVR